MRNKKILSKLQTHTNTYNFFLGFLHDLIKYIFMTLKLHIQPHLKRSTMCFRKFAIRIMCFCALYMLKLRFVMLCVYINCIAYTNNIPKSRSLLNDLRRIVGKW